MPPSLNKPTVAPSTQESIAPLYPLSETGPSHGVVSSVADRNQHTQCPLLNLEHKHRGDRCSYRQELNFVFRDTDKEE